MGNRGSISVITRPYKSKFSEKTTTPKESVCLFRHWGGDINGMIGLVNKAFKEMENSYRIGTEGYESEIIALLTMISCKELQSSAYLGATKTDGDNSDNGHFMLSIGEPHSKKLHWGLFHMPYSWKERKFEEKYLVKEWRGIVK